MVDIFTDIFLKVAALEWIACIAFSATAYCGMLVNVTLRLQPTRAWTWVTTFLINASSVASTV